ncbi:MAG TPA: glucose 1-dehydrogenase [Bauldia sp.]|nr:glucose 1-dehydrogenase [Bauldia sp.]
MRGLQGKNVLVTGGATGIGRAVSLRFAKEKANVAVNFVGDPEPADVLLEELQLAHPDGRHFLLPADVSNEDEVDSLFASAIQEFGALDVLIANAGIKIVAEPHEMLIADYDRLMAVNQRGAFLCAQAAIQHFLDARRPGAIVTTSSVEGIFPVEEQAVAYIMSKFSLDGMTRALALRYAREGIRVNAVAPGATRTPMNADFETNPDNERAVAKAIPIRRIGEPEEIAAGIAFLASDDASYIHGHTLVVDGGFICGRII